MATTANKLRQSILPRLCLLGSPGSGKGSYGQILGRHWGIPVITVSDVLKQRQRHNNDDDVALQGMASGKLVDDKVVSEALMDHLQNVQFPDSNNNNDSKQVSYLIDGYPRTIDQIHLMENTWPEVFQVQAAVHLNVPLEVCERKLLGRRICTICGNSFNVHGVLSGGFDLPAKLPRPGECHRSSALGTPSLPQQHNLSRCDATVAHWIRREDDQQDIIHHRLQVYVQQSTPILEHFDKQGRLFDFVPYKGFADMSRFQSELEEWILAKGLS